MSEHSTDHQEHQPEQPLPELSADQAHLMGELTHGELTAENLDRLGLPAFGEGVTAFSVDGEKRFINTSIEDYGTVTRPDKASTLEEAQAPGAEKFTGIIATELTRSADIAAKTVAELEEDSLNEPKYYQDARYQALGVLDQAARRVLNGETIPVTEELSSAMTVLRQASDQLALGVSGDKVTDRADTVRKSSFTVDEAANEYFKDADPYMEIERSGLTSQARTVQIEISSILHEDVTHRVDGINADESRSSDLISGIQQKLAYTDRLDEYSAPGLYRDVQELMSLVEASQQSRTKLKGELVKLADYAQQLRAMADRLVAL